MGEKTNKEVDAEKAEAEPKLLDDDKLEQIAAGTVPYSYAPDGRILPRS
ncbi:MAG: hypothetical protein OXB94_00830 [Nitrospira sp.]|nr:hypothetical protein [Nitrospira sp.]